jgi:hypothetical protein
MSRVTRRSLLGSATSLVGCCACGSEIIQNTAAVAQTVPGNAQYGAKASASGKVFDLVRDGGAPTDGVSSCATALANWRAWARNPANWPPTLKIDGAGVTNHLFNTTGAMFTHLVPNATINGVNGGTVTKLNLGTSNAFPMQLNRNHRSPIKSVAAGSATVTLVNAADASKYVVNQWCLIGGIETMTGDSYPSALQCYEYRKIVGMSGGVLMLDSALTQDYLSTWPVEPHCGDGPASVYGFGGIYCDAKCTPAALAACLEGTVTVNDLKVSTGFCTWTTGTALLNNIDMGTMTGPADGSSEAFSPSMGRKYVFSGCALPARTEIDKLIDYLEFNNCTGPSTALQIQSPTARTLLIKNNCSFGTPAAGGLGGTGLNTTIENSTIGQLWVGPTAFGVADSLTLTNATIGLWTTAVGGVCPPLSYYQNMGNTGRGLLLRLAKNDAVFSQSYPAPLARMIPGHAMALGYMPGGGPPNITPDNAQSIVSFRILDAYEDANYFYWQTDLSSIPSGTYNGQQPNMTWHYPLKSYKGPTPPNNYFVSSL